MDKDAAKAKELYEKAIDAGELHGYNGLGSLYQKGAGVEASGSTAAELYEKAAASDNWVTRNSARINLGGLYRFGAEGFEVDAAKAIDWYQKAADENYRGGWSNLGGMYSATIHEGNAGNEADVAKSFEYYSKAAELGEKYNLGVCFRDGKGCEQDYAKAIELFSQEAEGGTQAAIAMCALGACALNGTGMEKDNDVAADWFRKALDAAGPADSYAVEFATKGLEYVA